MYRTEHVWSEDLSEEQKNLLSTKSVEIYSRFPDFTPPPMKISPELPRWVVRFWPDETSAEEWISFLGNSNFTNLQGAILLD